MPARGSAGLDVRRQEQIARELDALAVEGHGLQHRSPRRRARDSFGSHAVFVGIGKYRGWTRPTILAINDEGEDRGGQGCGVFSYALVWLVAKLVPQPPSTARAASTRGRADICRCQALR